MKKIVVMVVVALSSFTAMAQVKWSEGSGFEDIKKEAIKEQKLVFLDMYATWCGPCIYMADNVFPTKVAGDAMNDFFVSAKFDSEKGEGKKLAKTYNVTRYPTLLIIDPKDGKVLADVNGSKNPEQFAQNIADALLNIVNK